MAKNIFKASLISCLTLLTFLSPSYSEINSKVGLQNEKSSFNVYKNFIKQELNLPICLSMDLSIIGENYIATFSASDNIPFLDLGYTVVSKGIIENNKLVPLETLIKDTDDEEYRSTYKDNQVIVEKKLDSGYKFFNKFNSTPKDLLTIIYNFRLNDLDNFKNESTEQVYFSDKLLTLDIKLKRSGQGYAIELFKSSSTGKKERYILCFDSNNDILELQRIEPKSGQFKVKSKKV
ncbi:hypothetical protein J4468_00360 [Candidatus Woesearchaeota archaeon]|nr:hypothetical protein [Candidatus Woesearchaeota archaeon]